MQEKQILAKQPKSRGGGMGILGIGFAEGSGAKGALKLDDTWLLLLLLSLGPLPPPGQASVGAVGLGRTAAWVYADMWNWTR
ncbi:hypothetical protein MLD38_017556 [Melastoma candidum]|uniref:Uncharacterized protein n=1 Tax=Melastoma candidum TaxID=119954 RepID=A0ACB9QRI7_9MYRT|nr:hypothetical protein MLD38_017556 [Melastoma candidum]